MGNCSFATATGFGRMPLLPEVRFVFADADRYSEFLVGQTRPNFCHMSIVVFTQAFLNYSRRLIGRSRLVPIMAVCLMLRLVAAAENPHWIWDSNHGAAIKPDETRYFRKTFQLPTTPTKALLSVAADDEAQVFINGKQ